MANIFREFFSEKDAKGELVGSSKRLIGISGTAVICFMAIYTTLKYPQYITGMFRDLLIFVGIVAGVATVAQIASIITRTPPPKDETNPPTEPKKD